MLERSGSRPASRFYCGFVALLLSLASAWVPADSGYAVIHYARVAGDYGDHTTGDYNDYWGLHVWGDGVDTSELTEWTSPKPFLGTDSFGRFAWIKRSTTGGPINFIIHRGDSKDGTDLDRSFDPSVSPEIWTYQHTAGEFTDPASARKWVALHYRREDDNYGAYASNDYHDFWGLHLWGEALADGVATQWTTPLKPALTDDFGVVFQIPVSETSGTFGFILHRGDVKDTDQDQSLSPQSTATGFLMSGDPTIYPTAGAATNVVTIHYHRPGNDYGAVRGSYQDFWGLHVWAGALKTTEWQDPLRPLPDPPFGVRFEVPLRYSAKRLAYILHRGDQKDPGPDQSLDLATYGYEVWQVQGADPEQPYVLPLVASETAESIAPDLLMFLMQQLFAPDE